MINISFDAEGLRLMKVWNYCSILWLLVSIYLSELGINQHALQKQFTNLGKIVSLIVLMNTILTNLKIIADPYYPLLIIDIGFFLTTLMVIISASRHGIHKD